MEQVKRVLSHGASGFPTRPEPIKILKNPEALRAPLTAGLDLPRGARRRAGDADRPNESEIESLTHTEQSTFTRWLIKPTSEARNTGAATPATHTIYPPR